MRACVQRVSSARVEVDGQIVGQIDAGLLVLLGVAQGDSDDDARQLAEKIVHLRIFDDEQGKMNRSLLDEHGSLLVVSQFTLLADCRKGRRPSYIDAARPEEAQRLYQQFMADAARLGVPVAGGKFQAHMHVHLVNNGPVTLWLDTRD
ncbi:MAG: D-aminoacyl-tRNA deacylase [Pirellulales bacterium]